MCIASTAEPFHWVWAFVREEEEGEEDEEEEEEDEEEEALPPTASSTASATSTEHWCVCGARLNPTWECVCID